MKGFEAAGALPLGAAAERLPELPNGLLEGTAAAPKPPATGIEAADPNGVRAGAAGAGVDAAFPEEPKVNAASPAPDGAGAADVPKPANVGAAAVLGAPPNAGVVDTAPKTGVGAGADAEGAALGSAPNLNGVELDFDTPMPIPMSLHRPVSSRAPRRRDASLIEKSSCSFASSFDLGAVTDRAI